MYNWDSMQPFMCLTCEILARQGVLLTTDSKKSQPVSIKSARWPRKRFYLLPPPLVYVSNTLKITQSENKTSPFSCALRAEIAKKEPAMQMFWLIWSHLFEVTGNLSIYFDDLYLH